MTALSRPVGAQIAILKHKAVGKRVSIWWADDEQFFEVSISVELRLCDTRSVRLWQSCQVSCQLDGLHTARQDALR